MRHSTLSATLALLTAALAACNDAAPPVAPRFDATTGGSISGAVLGPDGTSLCHALPDGATFRVQALNPPPAPVAIAGGQIVTCPDSVYAFPVTSGSYLLRVTLRDAADIGALPFRNLVTTPVVVAGDVRQDIRILPGTPLAGRATFDGAPFPGVALGLTYDQAPGYSAGTATSGDDGGWIEDVNGRDPIVLQDHVRYLAQPPLCDALGTAVVQGPPATGFLFPAQVAAINCALTAAPNGAFSHDRTRLVITPMPGDIGGLSSELFPRFGEGWGVQFPVTAGAAPQRGARAISQLFGGGLIVGLRPDRVLTGFDISGYAQCGATCRDLGLDGRLTYASSPQFGTKVIWHYSDATSNEAVGLKVLQKSYDGVPPNDYVLFHFIFTNSSAAPLSFYAGMFADWDIGDDPTDDIGDTAMGGRLMYMTDATPGGVFAGTLLLGAYPVSSTTFLTDFGQSTAEQVSILAGDENAPTELDPNDHRYVHALGPIALAPGASASMWIAVVAGETQAQLLANANAAAADVARRGADTADDAGGGVSLSGMSVAVVGENLDPRCKRGCRRP